MRALRPYAVLFVLAAACGTGSHRVDDASPEVEDEPASAHADAAASASGDAASTSGDAAAAEPARDAASGGGPQRSDGGVSAQLDAQLALDATTPLPGDAAPAPRDAQVSLEAAIRPCDFEPDAGLDAGCTGFVCSADGGTYVALTQAEPWYVGGLYWAGFMCRRPLGAEIGMTSDLRYVFFGLSALELAELDAKVPLFVDWGHLSPRARRCTIAPRAEPLPACPATGLPLRHSSLLGCRGPNDPGCTACASWSPGWGVSHRAAQPGADDYNVALASLLLPECAPNCRSCASCSYAEEKQIKEMMRPECLPCTGNVGLDPCFGAGSCECFCSHYQRWKESCPTLLP